MRKHITLFVLFAVLLMLISIPTLAAEKVEKVTVAVYPLTPNTASQYTIGFYTSSIGTLKGGSGDIIITFPEGTYLPSSISSGKIIVNGESVSSSDLDTDENVLTIELPKDVDVAAGGYVGIIIPSTAGIKTPTRAGSQYIEISTSRDSTGTSNVFTLEGTKISDLEVAVSPGTIDEYASYEISFKTSTKGALSGGDDYVYIEFPEDVGLPSSISSKYITVNGEKAGNVNVDRGKKLVAIRLPDDVDINKRDTVKVEISEDAHIRNPEDEGEYELHVYTSKDAYYRAEEYSVGVTVSAPVVHVSPADTGVAGQYSIGFTTSDDGALDGGDYIYLYFPEETYMPSSITKSNITINGYDASSISVSRSDDKISVRLPSGLNISGDAYVGVVVKSKAGVKNPAKSGQYRLGVSTSSDGSKVNSQEYSITGKSSGSGEMDINMSTREAGNIAEISLIIEAGSLGELEEGDKLTLDFPSAFDLPASINDAYITINGQEVDACKISGSDLEFKLTEDIPDDDDIEIIIDEAAGIENPEKEGDYELELSGPEASLTAEVEIGSTTAAKPEVQLSSKKAGTASQYTISFVADSDYDWDEGDILTIRFPEGTSLPGSIAAENIIVGSVEAERIVVSGNRLRIYLGDDLSIEEDSQVTILIPEFVGIENPTISGDYTLTLELPDDSEVKSEAYSIGDNGGIQNNDPVQNGKRIIFRVGSTLAQSNDQFITLQAAPQIIGQSTMVPLRSLGDALGASTSYDAASSIINVQYEGKTIVFIIGSKLAKVDEQWKAIDEAPTIINGRTIIPVRFVSESFGAMVEWDAATSQITITQ